MTTIHDRLLPWYRRHGRRDLPWHHDRDPYRIWVSEIMLQQTQVTTVIPYYQRFMTRLPTLGDLARTNLDEVLHLWTGLGYYARGRNLHRAAQQIQRDHRGQFPREFDAVRALPGIGRSTAGAILAFAFDQRHPILDGNVKRVLARYHRVAGWPGHKAVADRLWQLADRHTPTTGVAAYTQAIMDLGATLCTRSRPRCDACPLERDCAAHRAGLAATYPERRPPRDKPVRQTHMLMIRDADRHVLLEQRPPTGIWGGLWGFPECADDEAVTSLGDRLGLAIETEDAWDTIRHSFTHFHLDITPVPAKLRGRQAGSVMEKPGLIWYNPDSPDARGLAAPVKRLLEQLR